MLPNNLKDFLRNKAELINKLTYKEDRLKKMIEFREEIYKIFNDEIDEICSVINLKKNEDE